MSHHRAKLAKVKPMPFSTQDQLLDELAKNKETLIKLKSSTLLIMYMLC